MTTDTPSLLPNEATYRRTEVDQLMVQLKLDPSKDIGERALIGAVAWRAYERGLNDRRPTSVGASSEAQELARAFKIEVREANALGNTVDFQRLYDQLSNALLAEQPQGAGTHKRIADLETALNAANALIEQHSNEAAAYAAQLRPTPAAEPGLVDAAKYLADTADDCIMRIDNERHAERLQSAVKDMRLALYTPSPATAQRGTEELIDLALHVSFDPTWLANNGAHIERLVKAVLNLVGAQHG